MTSPVLLNNDQVLHHRDERVEGFGRCDFLNVTGTGTVSDVGQRIATADGDCFYYLVARIVGGGLICFARL